MFAFWEEFRVYLTLQKSVRPSTIRRYQTNFYDAALFFGTVDHFDLLRASEYLYAIKTTKAPATYTNYLITLRHFADFLVDNGVIETNFIRTNFKAPKKETRFNIQPLSVEEIQALLHAPIVYRRNQFVVIEGLREVYDLLHETLATTGARISEILNLRTTDLDFTLQTITFYKTKTRFRVIPMPDQLVGRLREMVSSRGEGDYVFKNSTDGRFAKNKVLGDMKKRAKLAGITKPCHPHLYRHSFATVMLANGASLVHVKEILGHERIETTDKYTHLVTKQLADAMRRYHPLIRQCMSVCEKVDDLETLVRSHVALLDGKIHASVHRDEHTLSISLNWDSDPTH